MEWVVSSAESGFKLIDFLASKLQISKKKIKESIERNKCLVNYRIERFANTFIFECDCVSFQIDSFSFILPQEDINDRILYEDEFFIAYDKPSGITCDSQGILSLWPSKNFELVHRLDKETSGVLLIAKSHTIFKAFVAQFREHLVKKRYFAIVDGYLKNEKGIIENYLGKKKTFAGQTLWASVDKSKGLYSLTEWECKKREKDHSVIICYPQTGRTHQIRVHMAEMGHPILGDGQYGRQFTSTLKVPRLCLHAEAIAFFNPKTSQEMEITAPLPKELVI